MIEHLLPAAFRPHKPISVREIRLIRAIRVPIPRNLHHSRHLRYYPALPEQRLHRLAEDLGMVIHVGFGGIGSDEGHVVEGRHQNAAVERP